MYLIAVEEECYPLPFPTVQAAVSVQVDTKKETRSCVTQTCSCFTDCGVSHPDANQLRYIIGTATNKNPTRFSALALTACMVAKRHTCLKIPKCILLSFKPMDYGAVFRKFECEHKMFEIIKCILLTFGLIISFQMGRESIARRGQTPPLSPPLLSMHPRLSSTCLGRVQWLDDDTSQMVQEKLDYLLHFTLSHPPAKLSNRNPE